MPDGDHEWFRTNFYDDSYYKKLSNEQQHAKIPQVLAQLGV
jgi:hypothetical protein